MPSQYQSVTGDISFYQRAVKGKIITEEKYKGGKPGSLDLRVHYDAGCLYVGLGQASLYGKPSQVIFYLSTFKVLRSSSLYIVFFSPGPVCPGLHTGPSHGTL